MEVRGEEIGAYTGHRNLRVFRDGSQSWCILSVAIHHGVDVVKKKEDSYFLQQIPYHGCGPSAPHRVCFFQVA